MTLNTYQIPAEETLDSPQTLQMVDHVTTLLPALLVILPLALNLCFIAVVTPPSSYLPLSSMSR
jgi:hypothetical protein